MTREQEFVDSVETVIVLLEKKKVTTTRAVEAMAQIRSLYHEMMAGYKADNPEV